MLSRYLKYLSLWDAGVLLISLAFVLVKIPFLGLPYFWDEAWVYAPAVFDMYGNGPSMSPDSINPQLSRGHPILFHFLASCWMTVFGSNFTAVHAFALCISVLLIWAVYKLGSQLANEKVGFWVAVLFALQPLFIQQSGFLLPEVQLALFVVLTVLFYIKRNIVLYILSGTAMMLTKETGILVIAALSILELVEFFRQRDFNEKRILEFVSVGIPVFFVGLYFLIQYYQFGWFMFPEHISMFNTEPKVWEVKRELVYKTVFLDQRRSMLLSLGLFASIFGWVNGPKLLRVLLLICALTFATMTGLSSWLPGWYYFHVFPVIIALAMIGLGIHLFRSGSKNHLFMPFVGIIVPVMLLFTSAHFVTGRYQLYLIPLVLIAITLTIHLSLKRFPWLFNALMVCLGLMLYHNANKADARESKSDNLEYVDQISVLRDGVRFLQEKENMDDCIAGSFLVIQALSSPLQGYLDANGAKPQCLKLDYQDDAQYALVLSYQADPKIEPVKSDTSFTRVFESNHGAFHSWVYKRK